MIRLIEQADRTGDLFCYTWILDGVSGRRGRIRTHLVANGWKWIPGSPGCYVTNDYALAKQTLPHVFGLASAIVSNGSHAAIGAKLYEEGLLEQERMSL